MEMSVTCVMILLVVMKQAFFGRSRSLFMREYVAVMTSWVLSGAPTFFKTGDGDHGNVTVQWDLGFFTSLLKTTG